MVLRGCIWYVRCYVRKKALLPCLLSQLLRGRDMALYEAPLSVSLLGFGMEPMLANSIFEVLCCC